MSLIQAKFSSTKQTHKLLKIGTTGKKWCIFSPTFLEAMKKSHDSAVSLFLSAFKEKLKELGIIAEFDDTQFDWIDFKGQKTENHPAYRPACFHAWLCD